MSEEYISRHDEKGSVNISDEVIAVMAATAVSDTEGVFGFSNSVGSEITELLGKKSVSKGIKIKFDEDNINIDLLITVHFGASIMTVAEKVQKAVCNSVESMTGIKPTVNVHVSGVAFDKQQTG
ncbi:MAG: Asp23/Gls24 family envelope stress response protein [Oscillospiraceae bacterium]|nr:Asp23/Gls24 family envelope stress response protein [Oscillospiraceae bacterium]